MIWYSCSRNRADPIFIVTLSFSKRTEHLMEHSASLIRGHPFCYQTIHSMCITVPWCALLVPLAATGLRCPVTARQTAGIVLDPSPLISQSKKGFPVSELPARQDAEGVCATFPFSRNPNPTLERGDQVHRGQCVQSWHTLTPVKGLGHMDYVTMERFCAEGIDCYEYKQSNKGWRAKRVNPFFNVV